MGTTREDLVIGARAEVGDAKAQIGQLEDSLAGLVDAEERLKSENDSLRKSTDDLADALDGAREQAEDAEGATKGLGNEYKKAKDSSKKAADGFDEAGDAASTAAKQMGGAKGEAMKFSDMLKQVGDGADAAAGKMLGGIGGPKLVGAIGVAAVAFTGIKAGVEAFNESSERLLQSYGDDGRAVWDEVEKSLFKVKGAFAETVLGSDGLYDAGAKLTVIYNTAYEVFKALLAPLGWLKDALVAIIPFEKLYGEELSSAEEALKRKTAAAKAGIDPMNGLAQADRDAAEALQRLYEVITPYLLTKEQMIQKEREHKIAIIETERAEVEAQLNRTLAAAASEKAATERATMHEIVTEEIKAEALAMSKMPGRFAGFEREFKTMLKRAEDSGEMYRRVTDKMIIRNAEVKKSINNDWSIAPALRQALVDADRAISVAKAKNASESMGDLMFGDGSQGRASASGNKIGTSFREGVAAGMSEGKQKGDRSKNMISAMLGFGEDAFKPFMDAMYKVLWSDADEASANLPPLTFMEKMSIPNKFETTVDFKVQNLEEFVAAGEKAQGIVQEVATTTKTAIDPAAETMKQIAESMDKMKKSAKELAVKQLIEAPSQIAFAWGEAAASGADASDAIGEASKKMLAGMASDWGQFFLGQAIGMAFINPAAAAGYALAGAALMALAGAIGASSEPAASGGGGGAGETGATGSQDSFGGQTSSGAGSMQGSFAYLEGGRSNVTIVTNDAASIRTMQKRLNMVESRGGSGV
jgi:hypothetical protein